jgi:hypothetical protein
MSWAINSIKKTSLPMNYLCMGSMDNLVWWDEETAVAYYMENSHTARIMLIVSYAIFELGQIVSVKIITCIIEMMYC